VELPFLISTANRKEKTKMKHFIIFITLVVLTFDVTTPNAHALFGSAEKQRRIETEQRLVQQQQQLTGKWQATAFFLGITSVVMLVTGAAIGSKGRTHAKPKK
jgi:fumarate reductase subunit C